MPMEERDILPRLSRKTLESSSFLDLDSFLSSLDLSSFESSLEDDDEVELDDDDDESVVVAFEAVAVANDLGMFTVPIVRVLFGMLSGVLEAQYDILRLLIILLSISCVALQ